MKTRKENAKGVGEEKETRGEGRLKGEGDEDSQDDPRMRYRADGRQIMIADS